MMPAFISTRSWLRLLARIWVACLLSAGPATAAPDKSGVQPTVLSLPSGPGSIDGLGESFQPQLNSGTAAYSVPFAAPPGRAGFAPAIGIAYNGGDGNGPVGLGWRLNLPAIQRQTDQGLPYYTDYPHLDQVDNDRDGETDEPDEWDTFIDSSGEALIPLADGSFRPKNESAFTRYERSGDGWLATQSDGTRLRFGTTTGGRIQDDTGRIFRWLLETMEDTNGNRIDFTHVQLDDSNQRYCRQIQYNGAMQVELVYAPRPDPFVDYRPRFALRTAHRLTEVRMTAGGEPVRGYRLTYAPTDDTQPLSLLAAVTQVGRDGVSTLPPAQFGYTRFAGTQAAPVAMPTAPLLTLNDGAIDLLDINADGLPDLLDTRDTVHDYYLNLGPDETGVVRWSARTGMAGLPTILDLASDAVQLADLDGDGHTDLLKLDASDARVYRIRDPLTAPAWEDAGLIRQALFNFQNRNTRLVDQNNDKRIDVMRTTATGDVFVWLNRPGTADQPNRWSSAFTPALPNPNLGLDRAYVRLADMNGDRLQDLVWMQNDLCTWYPGRGFGEYGTPVPMANPPFGVLDQARLLLADVNGDGLSDAIHVGIGTVRVWLNLGLDPQDLTQARFANPFTAAAPYTSTATVLRQADINGNGSQDILWNTHPGGGPDTFAYLDFAPGEQPYLLKTITNGIGLTTTVSYRASTLDWSRDRDAGRPWPQAVPFPVPVIARVETNDGLATYATDYQYHDGYYDGAEKEFRGFAFAEQRELGDRSAPDLITAYHFDTGAIVEALKGKPLALETRNAQAAVFHQETYTWDTRTLASAAAGPDAVTFAYQSRKLRTLIEQGRGDPVQIQWDSEYDDYGNLTRQVEHGRLDPGWDDERITQTIYTAAYPAGRARWMLGLPVEQRVTDEDGRLAARTRTYFDQAAGLGEVTRGNPTRTEDWVEGDHDAVTDRRDYDPYGNVTAIYDALYGTAAAPSFRQDAGIQGHGGQTLNRQYLADQSASPSATSAAASGHYRELVYDDTYHSFPIEERIHLGERTLTVGADYDAGLGTVTASTDFNGHRTTYGYDTFGRLTAITKPLDTRPTQEYAYVLAHPLDDGTLINWVETRMRETADGGTLDARTFYDGLGRAVMTRAEGEDPGQIVVSDTVQFNARKQPWRRYLPYFEQGTLDYNAPTFATPYTEHRYDALGREIRMTQPDGTYAETLYEPLGRTLKDEEQTNPDSIHYGAAMRYVHDGLLDKDGQGRLRQVYEITPEPWLTQYSYDLLDDFTGYIDAQNNRKFIEYDGLGRQRFMNDPDRGHMTWTYDDAGNVTRTLDAKDQVIHYAYDGANRLRAEWYGADTEVPDVEYHYDQPAGPLPRGEFWPLSQARQIAQTILQGQGAESSQDLNQDGQIDAADLVQAARTAAQASAVTAENTLGQLAWVRDQSGEEHSSYDARGRVVWTIKRIQDGSAGGLRDFYTAMDYDSMDRLRTLVYPDNDRASFEYNARGLLERIRGGPSGAIIGQLDYRPSGQKERCEYGDAVTTSYGYDARLRLTALESRRDANPSAPLIAYAYTFDGASNIRRIDDLRPAVVAPAGDPRRNTQIFDYDNLYRLTGVRYSFALHGQPDRNDGGIAYRYDRIGNMLSQTSGLAHLENGLSVTNLGQMYSGGTAGRFGREGRAPADSPGPHALTLADDGTTQRSYAYDANGNMRNVDGLALTWDFKDRLVAAENLAMRAHYTYDSDDRRIVKRVTSRQSAGPEATVAVYVNRWFELRDQGQPVKYVFATDTRVARIAGNLDSPASGLSAPSSADFISYYHQDHLGSSDVVLSEGGDAQQQTNFYPFGETRTPVALSPTAAKYNTYLFAQKELDSESRLQYFEARYLGASLGRFTSADPVLLATPSNVLLDPQQLSAYAYSRSSPIRYTDPSGKIVETIWDVANFAMGVASLASNVAAGSWGAAAVDMGGLMLDGAAAVVPFVPGGAGTAIKTARVAGKAADALSVANNATDVLRAGERSADALRAIDKVNDAAKRAGPHGVVPGRHNANVTLRDVDGNIVIHERIVSGNMTPAEKALGFPRNTLASHTEARAVTNTPLQLGQSMTITGQKPPCPSCKGYMNKAANETGATIRYQWRENGATQSWTVGGN